MTEPAALLAWLQLQDSAFPAGRFVHSHGLESWLLAHPTAGAQEIAAVVDAFVGRSVASLDAVLTSHSWAARTSAELVALDALATSYKLSESSRVASVSCGRQLATAVTRIGAAAAPMAAQHLALVLGEQTHGNLAVVEGVVGCALGIARFEVVLGSVRSAYSGALSAAVRLGRVGPMWAQRVLLEKRQTMAQLAEQATSGSLEDLRSTIPELDVYAMRHETATARMFTT